MRFEWNGAPATFTFTNQRLAARGGWRMDILMGGHEMSVQLSRLPDLAWISPTLAGIDLEALPPELGAGIISTSLGEIFEALSKGGIDVRITSVSPGTTAAPPEEHIEWCIDRGAETGWMRGRLVADDAGWEHLANLMQRAPLAPVNDDSLLPASVSFVIGSMTLNVAELQSLALHDVLLADLGPYTSLNVCQLWSARRLLGSGTLKERTFTLTQLHSAAPNTMADSAKTPTLNDLEIQLTFVAGQHTTTLGELKALAPGYIFELNTAAGEEITICANGKPVGTGEIIEVGGRSGIRVISFTAV